MKQLFVLFVLIVFINSVQATEVIEIDIHGMTCAFCSDGLQRSLSKLPEVISAKVSLKQKKVQVRVDSENIELERIKQAVIDSGFTPGQVHRNVNVE